MLLTATGIAGLDSILYGGIPSGSTVILEGAPGTGKTTLGMQFLYSGAVDQGDPGIYVTFEELPDQIYKEMKSAFGWDLRELEKRNLLRVVCLSPEIFLRQMTETNGIIEQMIRQIGSKRMAIDSVSLFKLATESEKEQRKAIYMIRNILRKFGQTSLLLQERSGGGADEEPFENFVADGVIRLALKEHMDKYRKRTLEVLKMRGTRIVEGEHQYKFVDDGIHVVPALSLVEDKWVNEAAVPTGIARLDRVLQGGIPDGAAFLIDTNSKANHKYLISSIFAEQIRSGKNVVSLNSSLSTVADAFKMLKPFGVNAEEMMLNRQFFVIEHYNRPYDAKYADAVLEVSGLANDEYKATLREKLGPIMLKSIAEGKKWFVYYDLNTIFSQRGPQFVTRFFAEEIARLRAAGVTVLVLCNFAEMDDEVASYLERSSMGVIRTWVDGNYQYLQVTKSPNGVVSEPLIVESTDRLPYVKLI